MEPQAWLGQVTERVEFLGCTGLELRGGRIGLWLVRLEGETSQLSSRMPAKYTDSLMPWFLAASGGTLNYLFNTPAHARRPPTAHICPSAKANLANQ